VAVRCRDRDIAEVDALMRAYDAMEVSVVQG
jgi:hypothetical protein